MRHDAHYVETLTSFSAAAVGRMIPLDKIRPNPDQPRKALGELRDLTASIREKGVLEPLLVRFIPREDTYYIISGERRFHAATAAGLLEVPCIEKIADDGETLEIALIENLQRKDLTAFEEADGLQRLAEQFSYTSSGCLRTPQRTTPFLISSSYGSGGKATNGRRGCWLSGTPIHWRVSRRARVCGMRWMSWCRTRSCGRSAPSSRFGRIVRSGRGYLRLNGG
jgi:ParB family chromosome partitioning protein